MISKKEEPVDLTQLTQDEIHHLGTCFQKELKEVLDTYRPYFINHFYYKHLDEILNFVKAQLEREERVVE